ncbi:MAG: hypothetical protein RMK18_09490 [Armatimonadota bacterium]|nr:hypothetical protein [Armatimonadota bacterium]MDW8026076.1 hypothetical protein [Armatimonadota bacterium]
MKLEKHVHCEKLITYCIQSSNSDGQSEHMGSNTMKTQIEIIRYGAIGNVGDTSLDRLPDVATWH